MPSNDNNNTFIVAEPTNPLVCVYVHCVPPLPPPHTHMYVYSQVGILVPLHHQRCVPLHCHRVPLGQDLSTAPACRAIQMDLRVAKLSVIMRPVYVQLRTWAPVHHIVLVVPFLRENDRNVQRTIGMYNKRNGTIATGEQRVSKNAGLLTTCREETMLSAWSQPRALRVREQRQIRRTSDRICVWFC